MGIKGVGGWEVLAKAIAGELRKRAADKRKSRSNERQGWTGCGLQAVSRRRHRDRVSCVSP